MRYHPPSGLVQIQQAVSVDYTMIHILQQRKIWENPILHGNPVQHLLKILRTINGNRQDFRGGILLFRQQRSQLTELTGAVGSPVPSIEDENDILRAPKL